ncbi:MAG TPA: hypothetical protein VK993_07760, partial [Chthoniobacterales bacterium]|nr:hypothetical protein [Chthoniobacterales bacterium]
DDAQVVETLESKLPPRAMVFQMPVADFPEIPPIHRMGPYDHFRPYLHSRSLRFSFGNNKGSGRDAWQHDAEQMDAASLVQLLERYGFAAIWINRKGYADDAASLVASLRNAGRADVLAQSADLVCIRLDPATRPALPPVFPPPWYNLEGTAQHNRRWSAGDATVVLFNQEPSAKPARVTFAIDVLGTRQVEISTPVNQIVFARKLSSGSLASVAIDLNLTPGENVISFRTDRLGELPGNGDPRPLAFNIQDFAVSY